MALATVDFTVTAGKGTQAYWIAVDEQDVPLTNGKGSVQLVRPERHMLVWWFKGNPPATLSIVGESGTKVVVEVKESRVPKKETRGAGEKHFDLK